jgi:dihydroorotate dehydrogenase (fumarate)
MDLTTTYLGLTLKNPLVASASPLSKNIEAVQKMEAAGLSAIVMYSLFEEQINHESRELAHYILQGQDTFVEVNSYYPDFKTYNTGPEGYIRDLANVKKEVSIPVIGSLNGTSSGGWIEYAQKIEQAGADALELNIYFLVTNPAMSSAEQEDIYVSLVHDVCSKVQIPVAVKLSPFFTALPNVARRLVEAGAKGLVLFNRFYQPDFDLENDEVVPNLNLSTSNDLRLPLRWISILYNQVGNVDFAATSGVHTAEDLLKVMMAGANVAMTTSALLKNGIEWGAEILGSLRDWMEENEYESVSQMRGRMSRQAVAEPAAFERANYMKELNSFEDNRFGGILSPDDSYLSV